jgi:hypothetical protein
MKKLGSAASSRFSVGGDSSTLGFLNPFADEAVKVFIKDAAKLRVVKGSGPHGAMAITPEEFKHAIEQMYEEASKLLSKGNWLFARSQLIAIMILSFTLHCCGATINSIMMNMISFHRDPVGSCPFNSLLGD